MRALVKLLCLLVALASSVHADERRITSRVPGLAESVDKAPPKGWKITHESMTTHHGVDTIDTRFVDAAGRWGAFRSSYDRRKKTFVIENAFLHPDSPRWVQHDGTALTNKGTPAQSYWTMYQANKLHLDPAQVEHVKISRVFNLETIAQLERAKRDGLDVEEVLPETPIVRHAETPLVQLGLVPRLDTLRKTRGERGRMKTFLEYFEQREPAKVPGHAATLSRYGLQRDDRAESDFDLTFDVGHEKR